ncbi:alkaline phosphatase family protein [Bacterioplanoides sp. SCSIO 12839]|uniref:alkaline phosphatase family protein n=1 Tax=Bacterioplanoides sp. SCSIO 12839 TaxID=2829569 RepID=UPI002103D225|nr:alkaline phosphatase family protein [Bacterioplanoides sp. SCSIO 12839]UTW47811.1 alkaline phosphatase family protein [Bacterioplanoides sp. SCSIO 12839]
MKNTFRLCVCLTALLIPLSGYTASKPPAPGTGDSVTPPVDKSGDKKVLLIGLDGVQLEQMQQIATPNMDRLIVRKAYTGGITGTPSEQGTSSGPGWSTILTGVWANKHGVTSNGSGLANPQFPSIFKRLRNELPSAKIASVVNWSQPNTRYFPNDVATNDVTLSGLSDAAVTTKGVELIQSGYDFIFLHIDDPDGAGHGHGFGSQYSESVRTADNQVGQLLDAVDQSPHDWLVLVTTDHGRQPVSGRNHGDQTKEEKTIFIASNKTLNSEFNTVPSGLNNQDFSNLYAHPAQTSLVPTALRYLGISIDQNWLLDGTPLLGEAGVRKLLPAQGNDFDITWLAEENGNIDIYRNQEFVTQVAATESGWSDDAELQGLTDYSLVKNNTPAAIRLNKSNITAAVSWDSTRAYFFRDDSRYIRYAKVLDKADGGFPKTTNNDSWPGFGNQGAGVIAAFEKQLGSSYYFFTNGQYVRYNNTLDRADSGYPKAINNNTWPGLGDYANKITAALRGNGDKVYFFLSDGQYLRFDLNNDQVDAGYPAPVNNNTWPGLGDHAKDIQAAIKWNNDRAYIFLTGQRYIRYDLDADRADAGYPAKVNNTSWEGVLTP